MSKINFNVNDVDDSTEYGNDFPVMPEGAYDVVVDRAEMVPTKAGGAGIKCTLQVVNGQYKGRLVWDFINIEHPNSVKAQNIGRARLKAMAHACGIDSLEDTDELLYKPFTVKLGVEPDTFRGGQKNVVKSIVKDNSAKLSVKQSKPVAQPVAPAVSDADDDALPF